MNFVLLCFILFLFVLPLQPSTTSNVSSTLNCSCLHYKKVENNWVKEIEDGLTMQKKALNILFVKNKEFSHTVPRARDKSSYLESFSNSFALVHRLTKIWPVLRAVISVNFGGSKWRFHLPINSSNVYNSALRSLVRLQETYNLSTESLARGSMEGAYPYARMTAGAVMDVGVFYYHQGHPWRALEWLEEALNRSDSDKSVARKTLLEYLHLTYCYTVEVRQSIETLSKLFQEYPSFSTDGKLHEDYNFTANMSCSSLNFKLADAFVNDITATKFVFDQAQLCMPDLDKPPPDPRLRCRLLHYNRPHLKLAPYKIEEVYLDPAVLLFHEVIHDGEIDLIIRTYHNKSRPALKDYVDEEDLYFDLQYNYWLVNATDFLPSLIDRRASSMANAVLPRSEPTMVASYGLGGEIKIHDDLITDESFIFQDKTRADYISFLIYLNEVAEGGYTIFPNLNVAVAPIKGAALMWHNRMPDWTRDYRTSHSGCPVLRGTKWIINKWFHVRGQDYPKCYPGGEMSREYYYLPDTS